MLSHAISVADVQPGDHLYRWRNLKLFQGIAVQPNHDNLEIFVVILNDLNSFCMVPVNLFKGKGILRRVLYNQGNSYLHWIKLPGTSYVQKRRPTEEIVQNALLLVDTKNRNCELIENLFVQGFDGFAKLCSTISHDHWRHILLGNDYNSSSISNCEHAFHGMSITPMNRTELVEDEKYCVICMERKNDVAFLCGHLSCSQCATALIDCHICRTNIRQKIKLFWS
ncbi:unnamed protein product [Rotaria magnacalcarata]|uniref:RING-type domain-containing protein n=1 Tax=Rotaria magnacalcarata TaxID=392030 RepID=A0A815ETZ3_9BILA|nr:unnamed protein product [Rotaria magnacalcarata]